MVFDDVDFSNIFVAVGLVPLLVQADEIDGARVSFHLLVLFERHVHFGSHLDGGWRASNASFHSFTSGFKFAGFTSYEARNPVHCSQLVEHRSTNSRHAVSFKLHSAFHVECFDRIHESEDAGGNQVVQIDPFRQLLPHTLSVVFDKRKVTLDQNVS